MITKYQQNKIKKLIIPVLAGSKVEVFIFGTAARAQRFGDVDLAVIGKSVTRVVRKIKSILDDSGLPYFFDVVDFSRSSKKFRDNVLNNKIIWLIKH